MFNILKVLIALAGLVLALASPVHAELIDGDRIVIIDGDTVELPCATSSLSCAERVHFIDGEAPDISNPSCGSELMTGLDAKARLAELLRGHRIWIERYGHEDPAQRTLAKLRIDGPSGSGAGDKLVQEGLALPWKDSAMPKTERKAHWCAIE